ncbi:Putative DNA helicase INO80 [Leucoagaricus sp. SymC.cos]|nr:Putative DNA helicase INO80 [Leucoagaricus sp. SymC.cos]
MDPDPDAPEPDHLSRKRRKNTNDDSSFSSATPRRGPPRKSAKRAKRAAASPDPDPNANHYDVQPPDDERQTVSSDLEACGDLWMDDLDAYKRYTKKHQQQIKKWFETSVLEQNAIVAQRLSHHYAGRIASIPLPPTSPPPKIRIAPSTDAERELSPLENGRDHDEQGRLQEERRRRLDAEDAALELERSLYEDAGPIFDDAFSVPSNAKSKGKAKEAPKRPVPSADSDSGSDLEIPRKGDFGGPAHKKRRIDKDAASVADDFERSMVDAPLTLKVPGSKSKGKGRQTREPTPESVSATPKAGRKKPGPKKKLGLGPELEAEIASRPPSVVGDVTPSYSRPVSPAPTVSSVVYELDEVIPPLKRAKKIDDASMLKRVKMLEDAQRKVWTNIAKRDVAKVYRYMLSGYQARQAQLERTARTASIQARKPYNKNPKALKDVQTKAKRLMREMQVLWKKNEKEERDVRKREQKEAMDRLKIEEEKREAARQARKLEFLISQTELYSHFVGSKLKTMEIEGDGEQIPVPAGVNVPDGSDTANLPEINFDDEDQTNLHRHARANAQEAIALAKARAQEFDSQVALDRKTNEALKFAKVQARVRDEEETIEGSSATLDLDSDELNFQNPTSLSNTLTIGQPKMLMAQLKEYQLKGLNWLATLYEQGINGILADEMGLGKTVQSISLLAYLAETHDIWGPFLVVAPASTLHNWQQEITRFVPKLKALPYWGNVKDRMTLRKFWSKKEISYDQDAPFHVLITSYQLVTQDQQYFQRVKWQYMVLDEAQNIKNSSSVRWKTLLGFHCRNRLLLTGTPIQNSMQELWALLHFIMPSLFDSHDEFNEWFSKDIENAAENKGSKLNEHQLRRLHMILKPFMLRRVKRHVQNELSEKIEKDIFVDLSARQRALYSALLANVSITDLLEKANNIGDADSARSLMNLVMQFRKVCNHPELFERADVVAPFSFSKFGRPGNLSREGDFVDLPYSVRNPIQVSIPKLFYQDGGFVSLPCESDESRNTSVINKLCNIWSTDWVHNSIYNYDSSSFSFLRFLDISPAEAHSLHTSTLIKRSLRAVEEEVQLREVASYALDPAFAAHTGRDLRILDRPPMDCFEKAEGLPQLNDITRASWKETCLSRAAMQWFIPHTVAPPIAMYSSDRSFLEQQDHLIEGPLETFTFYGLPVRYRDSEEACAIYRSLVPALPPVGLVGTSPQDQVPGPKMQVPEAKRLIYDSAKLACLDSLLHELREGSHRVLVYFQMTRMMDLMEEYLIYRQYKYLRLDGSSKIEDRRDMVIDWQTRPDIFVFLLSTRAGGLGINLTAADTVIFYDHDWNPSNDAQAMDRAHRLGQTRQVTVYRLITKGTIDERIVQLARVKKDVQDIVVGNKTFQDMAKPSEIVQLLLNDEQLANLDTNNLPSNHMSAKAVEGTVRDLWNEEGDEFFGHSGPPATAEQNDDDSGAAIAQSTKGRKRKTGSGAGRGRKPGTKKKDVAAAIAATDEMASNP